MKNIIKNKSIHKSWKHIRVEHINKLNKHGYNLYNLIYFIVQEKMNISRKEGKEIVSDDYRITLCSNEIKEHLGLANGKYRDNIKNALRELRGGIEIQNFTDASGVYWNCKEMSFISSFGEIMTNGKYTYYIFLNEDMFQTLKYFNLNQKSFALIELKYGKNLSVKQNKLWEFLKTYEKQGFTQPLGLVELNSILQTEHRYFSKAKAILESALLKINLITDLEVTKVKISEKDVVYLKIIKNKQGSLDSLRRKK